jgi:hypothetical protein
MVSECAEEWFLVYLYGGGKISRFLELEKTQKPLRTTEVRTETIYHLISSIILHSKRRVVFHELSDQHP